MQQELEEEQKMYDSITHHKSMKDKLKQDSLMRGRFSRYHKDAIKVIKNINNRIVTQSIYCILQALQERKEMIKNSRIVMSTLDGIHKQKKQVFKRD